MGVVYFSVVLKMSGEAVGLWFAAGFCWAWEYVVIAWYALGNIILFMIGLVLLLFYIITYIVSYPFIVMYTLGAYIAGYILYIALCIFKWICATEVGIAFITFSTAVAKCTGWDDLAERQKHDYIFATILILGLITLIAVADIERRTTCKEKQIQSC